jgi:hypothetical protein
MSDDVCDSGDSHSDILLPSTELRSGGGEEFCAGDVVTPEQSRVASHLTGQWIVPTTLVPQQMPPLILCDCHSSGVVRKPGARFPNGI